MTIQQYNDIFKNPVTKSMSITSSGGVTITNTNICMEQMSLEESLCSENILVFGACESGCFKIRIADLNHNFEGELLTVNQIIPIDQNTDETIPYGVFKVFSDKPTNDRRWRDLTCYDAMYDILNAEVIDWYNGLTFPMTMKNFRDSFFTYLGITQETTTLVNDSFMIQGGFSNEGSLSGKTIITSICELNGVFGHISRQGEFEYISLPSADSLTLDWYMDGTGAYEDYTVQKITGIIAKGSDDDVGTSVGTDTNVYIVQNNPLIYGSEGTQGLTTALTNLLNNVKDITYRPFSVNTYGNPMLPLGTNLTITTRNQTINSFLMTRVLSGIQSLKDSISADGEQYVPSQVNSLRTETKRTKGKIHELVNNVDELRSTIYDEDTGLISEIQQLSDEIVLKVDASGNIVKVALSANPSTGSTFAVNADNISFTAGSVLRFTANNIVIDSTNFDLDAQGNVVCNNLTATNADISGKITSTDGKIGNWNIGQNSIYSRYTIGQASYSAYMISESAKAEIFTQMQNSSFVQRASLKQGFFELGNSSGATMDTLNPMVTINCGLGTNKAYGYINLYDSEYYGGDYSKPITTVTNDGMSISANNAVKTIITKDGFKDTDFSTNRVLISDGNQFINTSSITSTELGYLSGASSNIQTQLNGKQATITGGATTIVSDNLTASKALVSNANGKVAVSNVTDTELGYLSGATSNIQGQLDSKADESDLDATPVSMSGNPITITDAANIPCESLTMTIEPIQSGSGTPSASNVRPITGLTEATVQTTDGTNTNTATISFGGDTVYGGTVDFNTGILTLTWANINVTAVNRWNDHAFYLQIPNAIKYSFSTANVICDKFPSANTTSYDRIIIDFQAKLEFYTTNTYSSASAFMSAYGGNIQVTYRLATPQTVQLTPAQLTLLKGTNIVSANGSTISLSYQKDNKIGDVKQWTIEEISKPQAHIYGVEWDGSSSAKLTRTDSSKLFADPHPAINNGNGFSPFDNLYPWAGMVAIDDATVGTIVSIPRFWYKWTKDGSKMKLQIADAPVEGFHVSPAHMDRGDGSGERKIVYVGRYHNASDYKSKTGVTPLGNKTRAEFRTGIHNLGSTIWQVDYAMLWTIRMLYLVEFADWNSQECIGYGCGNNSSPQSVGASDNMKYHTGTSQASRTTYGVGVQYRHIEGLWDNAFDFWDGIYFSGTNVYGILNPSNFSDSANGVLLGTRPITDSYITAWNIPSVNNYDWALFPSAGNGSETTYVTDVVNNKSTGVVALTGGFHGRARYFGLFFSGGDASSSEKAAHLCSRLMVLP